MIGSYESREAGALDPQGLRDRGEHTQGATASRGVGGGGWCMRAGA